MYVIDVPERCILNRSIAVERIFKGKDSPIKEKIDEITWVATLKPEFTNLLPSVNSEQRYEEIQIMKVVIHDAGILYDICRPIFQSVKTPCILLMQYEQKMCVSACQFHPAEKNYEENVLHSIVLSHWIYLDALSHAAKEFLEKINSLIAAGGEIAPLYERLCHEISLFHIGGISKAHVSRILYAMVGKKSISHLLDNCTPYHKYFSSFRDPRTNAGKSGYECRYDLEDLWYAFQHNESTKKVILGRKYADINELIYRVDQQYTN